VNSGKSVVRDDLLVLVKNIGTESCMAYVPYGPKEEPEDENQGVFLEELSEAVRPFLPEGCTEYDMFGTSPNPDPAHPMYGLFRFKTGFGGNLFHRMGCWDYPFDNEKYELFRAREMNGPGYHIN